MENNKINVYSESMSTYIAKVYGWMTMALCISGFIAFYTANSPTLLARIYGNPPVIIVLIIGQLAMVMLLSAGIKKMSSSAASAAFLVYSVLNGFTLSFIFMIYTSASIYLAFFITAITFGAVSIYGITTKKDLTSIGNLLFMGLIGIIIASVVNMFLGSTGLYYIISYISVVVFVGLTAYDTQRIKGFYYESSGKDYSKNLAIFGALMLYLDFVNLLLNILRILNGKK